MNLQHYTDKVVLNGQEFDFKHETYVMGILNVTPDSFSDGGKYNNLDDAISHAKQMLADGAKIIDVGGESTRPGYTEISVEEELARVVPVIRALREETDAVISIDTYKADVARGAIEAGAHIINDIWGARREPEIAKVAAELNVPIILMHNRTDEEYADFWQDVQADLEESIEIAKKAGVPDHHIWLDPGIGFAKSMEQNVRMMRKLDQLVDMGYPVLLATSKKRVIGAVLDLPVDERTEGTGATVCFGIQLGCHMVRVHDVKEISRMVRMMDVLVGKKKFVEA